MAKQSSLDRLLAAQGCPGLDNLIPKICERCSSVAKDSCRLRGVKCGAMVAILSMASKFSAQHESGQADIHSYFENLKDVASQ